MADSTMSSFTTTGKPSDRSTISSLVSGPRDLPSQKRKQKRPSFTYASPGRGYSMAYGHPISAAEKVQSEQQKLKKFNGAESNPDGGLKKSAEGLAATSEGVTRYTRSPYPAPEKPLPPLPTTESQDEIHTIYSAAAPNTGVSTRSHFGVTAARSDDLEPQVGNRVLPKPTDGRVRSASTISASKKRAGSLFRRRRPDACLSAVDTKTNSTLEALGTMKSGGSLNYSRPFESPNTIETSSSIDAVQPLNIVKKTPSSTTPSVPARVLTEAEHKKLTSDIFERELAKDKELQEAFRESLKALGKTSARAKRPDHVYADGFSQVDFGVEADSPSADIDKDTLTVHMHTISECDEDIDQTSIKCYRRFDGEDSPTDPATSAMTIHCSPPAAIHHPQPLTPAHAKTYSVQSMLDRLTGLDMLDDDATEFEGIPLRQGRPDKVDDGGYWPGGRVYTAAAGRGGGKRGSGIADF